MRGGIEQRAHTERDAHVSMELPLLLRPLAEGKPGGLGANSGLSSVFPPSPFSTYCSFLQTRLPSLSYIQLDRLRQQRLYLECLALCLSHLQAHTYSSQCSRWPLEHNRLKRSCIFPPPNLISGVLQRADWNICGSA